MSEGEARVPFNLPVEVNMRQPPVTVSLSDTVTSVMFQMINQNIGAVIVVDEGRAVGIITEKDVLEKVIMREKDVYTTSAKDVMSTPLISIEAHHPIQEALELMRQHEIKRLAITKNGTLIGLVTEKRLLEAVVRWGYAMTP